MGILRKKPVSQVSVADKILVRKLCKQLIEDGLWLDQVFKKEWIFLMPHLTI